MEVFPALSACSLFAGLTQDEIAAILPCLSARQAGFRRGQFLLRAGDEVRFAGVVLAGEVELLQEDFWGNRNLLAAAGPGELFAEAFACVQARAPVSVLCKTDGRVLYPIPARSFPRAKRAARSTGRCHRISSACWRRKTCS